MSDPVRCANEEDDCTTPLDDVRDYYADAPYGNPEAWMLCVNCRQNEAERAYEVFQGRFYGGSDGPSLVEQQDAARRLK